MKQGVAVELRGVRKSFVQDRTVFESLDLKIEPAEFVAVVGSSGCGKSTLLRLVAGLEALNGGTLQLTPAAGMGFVFQEAQLLPWRTVRDNTALPLEFQSVAKHERGLRADRALEQVGMEAAATLYPGQLSGGMKMRVSLARALVTEPSLLLLDEPFAALDELTRMRLEEDLRSLWRQTGMTILLVTHSFSEAVFLSDRIVMVSVRKKGVGDTMAIGLGEGRTESLRGQSGFSQLVLECRRRFERLEESAGHVP